MRSPLLCIYVFLLVFLFCTKHFPLYFLLSLHLCHKGISCSKKGCSKKISVHQTTDEQFYILPFSVFSQGNLIIIISSCQCIFRFTHMQKHRKVLSVFVFMNSILLNNDVIKWKFSTITSADEQSDSPTTADYTVYCMQILQHWVQS